MKSAIYIAIVLLSSTTFAATKPQPRPPVWVPICYQNPYKCPQSAPAPLVPQRPVMVRLGFLGVLVTP